MKTIKTGYCLEKKLPGQSITNESTQTCNVLPPTIGDIVKLLKRRFSPQLYFSLKLLQGEVICMIIFTSVNARAAVCQWHL